MGKSIKKYYRWFWPRSCLCKFPFTQGLSQSSKIHSTIALQIEFKCVHDVYDVWYPCTVYFQLNIKSNFPKREVKWFQNSILVIDRSKLWLVRIHDSICRHFMIQADLIWFDYIVNVYNKLFIQLKRNKCRLYISWPQISVYVLIL